MATQLASSSSSHSFSSCSSIDKSYSMMQMQRGRLNTENPLLLLSLSTKLKHAIDSNYSDLSTEEFRELVSTLSEELACFALIDPQHDAVCLHALKVVCICAKSWTSNPVSYHVADEWANAKSTLRSQLEHHYAQCATMREKILAFVQARREMLHQHAAEIAKRRRAGCILLRQDATRAIRQLQNLEQVSLNLNRAVQQLGLDEAFLRGCCGDTTSAHETHEQDKQRRRRVCFAATDPEVIGTADPRVDRSVIPSSFPSTKELLLIRATRVFPTLLKTKTASSNQ